jgi:hypothetical protein
VCIIEEKKKKEGGGAVRSQPSMEVTDDESVEVKPVKQPKPRTHHNF